MRKRTQMCLKLYLILLLYSVKHCLSDNAGPSVRTLAYRLLRYSLIDRDSANIYISQGVNFYLIRLESIYKILFVS